MGFVCSNSELLYIWLIFKFIIIENVVLLNIEKNYINSLLNLDGNIDLLIGKKINNKIFDSNYGLYNIKKFFWKN